MKQNEDGGICMSKKMSILPVSRKAISKFLNTFPGHIMCISQAGKIDYCNNSVLEILEYTTPVLKGRYFSDLVEDKASLQSLIIAWQDCATISGQPLTLRTKRGNKREVIIESSPFCANSKNPTSFVFNLCYIKNVTRLRAAERERDELLKQTQELLKKEECARLHAERANRAKDLFFKMMSHELRTPLTAILGWLRLFRGSKLDQNGSEKALDIIQRNAQSQAILIDELLNMSRILSGKLLLQTNVLDLDPVISDVIADFHQDIEQKNLSVRVSGVNHGVNILIGDEAKLRQVLHNLLSNSIKFTPCGGVIDIRTEQVQYADQDWVQIVVADNGVGIKKEFLPYVFEKFKQQEEDATRTHGGLGLGLAITHHIVEAHRGTISVHSNGQNTGAVFTVRLPLLPKEECGNALYITPSPCAPIDAKLEGVSVLVVEDEKDTRDMLVSMLEMYDMTVREASGTDEALAILDEWTPDLILSDIGMPEKNGYVFMDMLQERGSKVPAIALTAFVEQDDRNKALARGFVDHVPKPIETDVLINKISKLTAHTKPAGIAS